LTRKKIREKLVENLQTTFYDAAKMAKGEVTLHDEELTLKERHAWARVAAYTAQVIESVAKGFDEQKINYDLEKLERLIARGLSAKA
jgi:hypothetical protein